MRSLAILALASACIDTSVVPTSVTLRVEGTAVEAPIAGREGATIELERADLAFGPLTLCAGVTAGDSCDTALAEWPAAAVVDALAPEPRAIGALEGITGTARSYMYDLGFVSTLTAPDPLVLPAAESLDGASVRLEGRATVEGVVIPFAVSAILAQSSDVERGIPVVRSGTDDAFTSELVPGGSTLTVTFDPRPWVSGVDFAGLLQDASCTAGGPPVICAGMEERRCDADGGLVEATDCAARGEVCIRGRGCVPRVDFEPGSQGAAAVRDALLAGAPPTFTTRESP